MTPFCHKYPSGSPHNLMMLSFLKMPRPLRARPANHGIGPVPWEHYTSFPGRLAATVSSTDLMIHGDVMPNL
jgi:hypothetical protein